MSNRTLHAENCYDRVIEILTQTTQAVAQEQITLQDFLPALVDFTASVALAVAGEDGLRAFVARMQGRIADWRAGTFPARDFDLGPDDDDSGPGAFTERSRPNR